MQDLHFSGLAFVAIAFASAMLAAHDAYASGFDQRLCPSVILKQEIQPALDANERTFICGNEAHQDVNAEGWSKIPLDQAIFTLKNALQSRGYLNPTFQRSAREVQVDLGPITRVTELQVDGSPVPIDMGKKRDAVGQALTPKVLDSVEAWVRERLGHAGYPCAKVKAQGDPRTGTVTAYVSKANLLHISEIRVPELGTDLGFLRRYDPFRLGDPYDEELLGISADRAMADGVVERTYFAPVCPADSGAVQQGVVLGGPHVLALGLGINTEEVGVARLHWKRVRLGENASSVTAEARGSFKIQELSAYADWRFASPASRALIRPLLSIQHQNEDPFELYSERGMLGYGTQADWAGLGLGLVIGPDFELFQTRRGGGPARAHALALRAELQVISHNYEFRRNELQGGYRLRIEARTSRESVASTFGAEQIRARAQEVWNLFGNEPAILALGIKGGYLVTFPEQGMHAAGELPPDFRQYLGGQADLRGFGRMELPGGAPIPGGLSAGYASLEIRTSVAETFQPLVFADFGSIGRDGYFLSSPLYWSPGAGLAWKSPVGPVHATLAHGRVNSASAHWQFYLSLGEPL